MLNPSLTIPDLECQYDTFKWLTPPQRVASARKIGFQDLVNIRFNNASGSDALDTKRPWWGVTKT